MSALVTVILTTYNSSQTLERTLQSIETQSYRDIELVIVDDASSDNTIQKLRSFKQHSSIHTVLIINEKNQGVADARNKGIKHAKGDYISFIDSDDEWLPEKTGKEVQEMIRRGLDFAFTNYLTIDENGNLLSERNLKIGPYQKRDFFRGNPAGLLTVMVRHDLVDEYLFPTIGHEDYAAWIKIMDHTTRVELLDQSYAKYRIHKSLSSNKIRAALWTYIILKDYGHLNGFSRFNAFIGYLLNILKREKRL